MVQRHVATACAPASDASLGEAEQAEVQMEAQGLRTALHDRELVLLVVGRRPRIVVEGVRPNLAGVMHAPRINDIWSRRVCNLEASSGLMALSFYYYYYFPFPATHASSEDEHRRVGAASHTRPQLLQTQARCGRNRNKACGP